MDAAVIGKASRVREFMREGVAAVLHVGVPEAGRMARRAGGGAMIASVPDPVDRVPGFDRDRGGREFIAATTDIDGNSLGRQGAAKKKEQSPAQAKEGAMELQVHTNAGVRRHPP